MRTIRELRPVTYDGFLPFIHWAEDVLVDQLHYEQPSFESTNGPTLRGFEG